MKRLKPVKSPEHGLSEWVIDIKILRKIHEATIEVAKSGLPTCELETIETVLLAMDKVGLFIYEKNEEENKSTEQCPRCKKYSIYAQPKGGIACRTEGCGYWFCY